MKQFTHLIRRPEQERFAAYLMPIPEAGCALFMGEESHNGYGRFRSRGRRIPAHRYAWMQERGPIPDGLMVCHKCDTPKCCNVEHLFLGTCKQNKADSVRKGRHARGRVVSLAKATRLTPEIARCVFDASGTHQSIADSFGIGRQTVTKIKARKAWAWIHKEAQA